MRKSFGVKPMVYPMPVFIIATYGDGGVANAMNAAWGGISEENEGTFIVFEGVDQFLPFGIDIDHTGENDDFETFGKFRVIKQIVEHIE